MGSSPMRVTYNNQQGYFFLLQDHDLLCFYSYFLISVWHFFTFGVLNRNKVFTNHKLLPLPSLMALRKMLVIVMKSSFQKITAQRWGSRRLPRARRAVYNSWFSVLQRCYFSSDCGRKARGNQHSYQQFQNIQTKGRAYAAQWRLFTAARCPAYQARTIRCHDFVWLTDNFRPLRIDFLRASAYSPQFRPKMRDICK